MGSAVRMSFILGFTGKCQAGGGISAVCSGFDTKTQHAGNYWARYRGDKNHYKKNRGVYPLDKKQVARR